MKNNLFLSLKIFIFALLVSFAGHVYAEIAPKIIPPATAEMQTPEYWIKLIKDPDRVVMTPAQIEALNKKNMTRPYSLTDINGKPFTIEKTIRGRDNIGIEFHFENPLNITSFPADSLRARMAIFKNYIEKGTFYDRRQYPYDDNMKKALLENADINNLPSKVTLQYGILVKHTLCRIVPTNEFGMGGPGSWLDQFQAGSLDYGAPVAILHKSKDKSWLYVKGETSFGWIPADNVAFAASDEIRKITDAKNFIVSIGHKVPIYGDSGFNNFIADFYLGAKVPLIEKSAQGYKVTVPVKGPDGVLKTVQGWVKPEAKVNVGYQKFTQRNILETFFSLIYRPYGWADSDNERDCCGTTRTVYKTFGILLPRWTDFQLLQSDYVHAFPENTPNDVKHSILDKCEPAITLIGHPGHIVMYIGKVNNDYFVIHQSGYSYWDDKKTEFTIRRVNVNDTNLQGGSQVNTWCEITEFKP